MLHKLRTSFRMNLVMLWLVNHRSCSILKCVLPISIEDKHLINITINHCITTQPTPNCEIQFEI